MINQAIIERVQKLIRLSKDGGATEAEAALAAAKAQEIMAEHNLTMATLGDDNTDDAKRQKEEIKGFAMYNWQQELMRKVGEVNFCWTDVHYSWGSGSRRTARGYKIIGRAANVASTQVMFEYLRSTISRLALQEVGGDKSQLMSNWSVSFQKGCAAAIIERLGERHRKILDEQERKVREERARASHPSSAPTHNALVVLAEYASSEQDLNEDFRRGVAPGTTARERAEWKAGEAERQAKYQAERERKEAEKQKLIADGVDSEVAYYIVEFGWDEERAAEYVKREARNEKRRKGRSYSYSGPRDTTDYRAYRSGESAGRTVGLDPQVGRSNTRRIR